MFCSVDLVPALEPTFLDPQLVDSQTCPAEVGMFVKVQQTMGAYWKVSLCPTGCDACEQQQHPVGAPGLSLPTILPPILADQNDPEVGCYFVEAEALAWQGADRCVYESMAIFGDAGLQEAPIFVATRDDWGMSWGAHQILGGWDPNLSELDACACEDVDPQLVPCCDGEVRVHDYVLDNQLVSPPGEGLTDIGGFLYTVFAMQAQLGASCEGVDEISWALRLEEG